MSCGVLSVGVDFLHRDCNCNLVAQVMFTVIFTGKLSNEEQGNFLSLL